MAQPDSIHHHLGSTELNLNGEDSGLSKLPNIEKIPTRPMRSEITPAPPQPSIHQLPGPTYVTRKDHLGSQPGWIDCDFCKRRTETRVEVNKIPTDQEAILGTLLCLVCPCLICLACMGDDVEVTKHYCTGDGCGRQVTYQRDKSPVQVMQPQAQHQEVSKYGVAATKNAMEGKGSAESGDAIRGQ